MSVKHPRNGGETASYLGNTQVLRTPPSIYGKTPDDLAVQRSTNFLFEKYRLQSVARFVLERDSAKWRVCNCCRKPVGKFATMRHSSEHSRAFWANVETCSSVWVCPVCSVKISTRRADELLTAIPASDLTPILNTFTIQHHKGDKLKTLLGDLKTGYRHTFQTKPKRRFYECFGIVGYITTVENRYSFKTSWHPHLHQMMLSTRSPSELNGDEIKSFLLGRYGNKLSSLGYLVNNNTVDVRVGHGDSGQAVQKYLTKWSMELTGGNLKSGKSVSPFQLLDEFSQTGDLAIADLFTEYANATKGQKQLIWSRGLLDLLGVRDKSDEEVNKELIENASLLGVLTSSQFGRVIGRRLRAEGVHVASAGDLDVFKSWLIGNNILLVDEVDKFDQLILDWNEPPPLDDDEDNS